MRFSESAAKKLTRAAIALTFRGLSPYDADAGDLNTDRAPHFTPIRGRILMSTHLTQSDVAIPRPVAPTENRDASCEPQNDKARVAAIFRRELSQAAALATRFKEAGVDAVTLESAEALRGLLGGKELDLLVLDNELDGFFTGLEVIRKLRASLIRVPAILLNRNSESGSVDAKSAGAVTVIDAATEEAAIVKLGLGILERQSNDANGIPERARAIVERQSDLPVLSQLTMQLLQYLEMSPEQVPVADLCRLISIDPRATAVLLKAGNASANGVSRSITNVADAVRVLGVRPTIGHVLNAAVTSGLGALSKGLPSELQSWHARRGMFIACTTSSFGQELENRSDEAAFLVGILQDVGILALLRLSQAISDCTQTLENDRAAQTAGTRAGGIRLHARGCVGRHDGAVGNARIVYPAGPPPSEVARARGPVGDRHGASARDDRRRNVGGYDRIAAPKSPPCSQRGACRLRC